MSPNILEYYLKEYNGLKDRYLEIFELISRNHSPQKVLYPGSYCHLTPSLVYPFVVYVDNLKKIKNFFINQEVLSFVRSNRKYDNEAVIKFYFQDYRSRINEQEESFDLMISLNAGFISQACKSYLKKEGILLVNDEHYDARQSFVDKDYQLFAVYSNETRNFDYSKSVLEEYFKTSQGITITQEMIDKSKLVSPSKDPFKTKYSSAFYLFEKKS